MGRIGGFEEIGLKAFELLNVFRRISSSLERI
jgi:hypothetical protein